MLIKTWLFLQAFRGVFKQFLNQLQEITALFHRAPFLLEWNPNQDMEASFCTAAP